MGGIRIVDSEQEYENEYTARFADDSIEGLVQAFNSDQPSQGWVSARGRFLAALRQAFLDTEIDCSSIDFKITNITDHKIGKIEVKKS